jgi:GTP-binding protein YchF
MEAYDKVKTRLESGQNVRGIELSEEEQPWIEELNLLTIKPVLYVANVDVESLHEDNKHVKALRDSISAENAQLIRVSAAIEAEIAELTEEEDKIEFLKEYGLEESGLSRLISEAYKLLDLITYFTAGVKEVRAWTIQRGWKAPKAASVIHSDFEKGFIRAEVIKISNYEQYKTEAACRDAGKLGVEGKEYVVEDGDVMHFRFNV